eukprot:1979127-Pyramimonas_sp.AAC.1
MEQSSIAAVRRHALSCSAAMDQLSLCLGQGSFFIRRTSAQCLRSLVYFCVYIPRGTGLGARGKKQHL